MKRQPDWNAFRYRMLWAPRDVQLHVVPHSVVEEWARRRFTWIDGAERAEAEKLTDPQQRKERLASAVILRQLLAHRLSLAPEEVRFRRTRRPQLDPAHGYMEVSLARASGFVAIATAQRPVGTDVEARQSREQAQTLLYMFHPLERRLLSPLPEPLRSRAVTAAWTRKEAVLKSWGLGLSRDPALDFTGAFGRRRVVAEGVPEVLVRNVTTPSSSRLSVALAWAWRPRGR